MHCTPYVNSLLFYIAQVHIYCKVDSLCAEIITNGRGGILQIVYCANTHNHHETVLLLFMLAKELELILNNQLSLSVNQVKDDSGTTKMI